MIHVLSTTVTEVLEGTRERGGTEAFVSSEDVVAACARRGAHAHRTLAGRAALRLLLAHALGEAPERARGLTVDRTCEQCGAPHGRPRAAGVSLSGSTSEDQVLVAVAGHEACVGVDVQTVPDSLWPGFNDAVLHPLEQPRDSRLAELGSPGAPVRLWTRKEALLKAAGIGLRIDPSRIALVHRSPAEPHWWSTHREAPPDVQGLHVRDLPGAVPRAVAASALLPVHDVELAAVLADA